MKRINHMDKITTTTMLDIKFTGIHNARIAYKTYGSGEPLIMCIGYATNMDLWSTKLLEILQKHYKVIVFDYRGMGYSATLADDLNELLIALKIEKAHLLGWSMGGFVAQRFALTYPNKVNKLILYGSHYGGVETIAPEQKIIDILSNPAVSPMELISTLFPDEWLSQNPAPWLVMPTPNEPYNYVTIGLQYAACQGWLSTENKTVEQLDQLKMPVLVICGEQDKIAPSQNSVNLAKLISHATLVEIPNSGHGLMYQEPELFTKYLLDFLAK